ncbi:MAG: hypothetical protein COA36_15965 [Desulfotalea sp.]|nr:MAG: hypothetical protein COA36_15965 [Desulfotalea sp.]
MFSLDFLDETAVFSGENPFLVYGVAGVKALIVILFIREAFRRGMATALKCNENRKCHRLILWHLEGK